MAAKRQAITAVILDKRGRTLSVGKNSYVKTHPLQARIASEAGSPEKIYLHAEIDALTKLEDPSKAHAIHVFRYDAKGRPVNAKPCPVCERALLQFGVKNIFHT